MHPLLRPAGLAGLLLASVSARADVERTIKSTFAAGPACTVHVATSGGFIQMKPSEGPGVTVMAVEHFRASSEAEADEMAKQLSLVMEAREDGVYATAKYEGSRPPLFWGSWPPVWVDFVVSAPASSSASLRTSGGAIEVGDFGGRLEARTSGGPLQIGRIGGDVVGATSGGGIFVAECGGAARLTTSGGSVKVGRLAGPAQLRTSGGRIEVGSAAGTLDAETSGGGVRAAFEGPLKGDCLLRSSGGSIQVRVPAGAGFELDAATSGGGVRADGVAVLVERGAPGHDQLAGQVNGGGPLLRLRTSGGSIEVATR